MLLIFGTRQLIEPSEKTEKDLIKEGLDNQIGRVEKDEYSFFQETIEEALKFPKKAYMHYPFLDLPDLEIEELTTLELDQYSFLGFNAESRFTLDPFECIRKQRLRTYIGFYPKNDPYAQLLQRQLDLWSFQHRDAFGMQVSFHIIGFNSEEHMMNYVAHPDYETIPMRSGLCFGVSHYREGSNKHTFKLHFYDQDLDERQNIPSQTRMASDPYETEIQYDAYTMYNSQMFSSVHNWLANFVLRDATGNQNASIASLVMQMKIESVKIDSFDQIAVFALPLAIILMYIVPIHRMVVRIVNEKRTGVTQRIKQLGLSSIAYWSSWFIYYFSVVTVIAIISTIILHSKVLIHSDPALIFVFFWLYGLSLFGYVVFMQSFFTNERTASIISNLIYFFTSFADLAVDNSYLEEYRKILGSILPSIAMSRSISNIVRFEKAGVGLQNDNIFELYQNYRVITSIYMFFIGFFLSLVIGLILNDRFTQNKAKRLSLISKLQKMCSIFNICQRKNQVGAVENKIEQDLSSISANEEHKSYTDIENRMNTVDQFSREIQTQGLIIKKSLKREDVSYQMNVEKVVNENLLQQEKEQQVLKIQDLKKTFDNGFQAIKDLNLTLYQGQIFALLGHNGAGKTTTIKILTGLLEQSSGSCELFGLDLFKNMKQLRSKIGVCPQQDILFDLLTPEEHLALFYELKCGDENDRDSSIQRILEDVDLFSQRNVIAKNLSGGNKRKLSVALAFVGDSKLILLDEPTSGMDINVRRKIWNMLKNYKQDRIIILTTHYMDEADILGDRIGIMSQGQIRCLGSSLFLKNKFGIGYRLTLIKKEKSHNKDIEKIINQYLENVRKLSEIHNEVTYQIPQDQQPKLCNFFTELDQKMDSLNIKSYGITVTSLEDVFLQMGDQDYETIMKLSDHSMKEIQQSQEDSNLDEDSQNMFQHTFCSHLAALIKKRLIIYKRDYKALMVEIFIPALLILIGFGFSKIQFFFDSPNVELSTNAFQHKQRLLLNSDLIVPSLSDQDISISQIIQNLPHSEEAFEIKYNNYSSVDLYTEEGEKSLAISFDSDVYNEKFYSSNDPSRYGSYLIYQADNETKQFRFATWMNLTSQDVSALYPQFMYESILKLATGDQEFQFKIINAPFPVTYKLKRTSETTNGAFIVFVIAIGFALIPGSIISFIVHERINNLKHLQILSGLSRKAYWFSNFIFDVVKFEISSGIVIGLMYALNLNYDNVWILFLLYPLGVIPFTYATSFIFPTENFSQTFTIFLHFVISGIGAIVVSIIRMIETIWHIGDQLSWAFKIVPSFCLTNTIMYEIIKKRLKILRPDLKLEDFDLDAIGGDILFLCLHGIFWLIVIMIIETHIIQKLIEYIQSRCRRNRIEPEVQILQDEDVIEEQNRIESSQPHEINIRVHKLRKVYRQPCKKPVFAVVQNSFGVNYGECFALLGTNGAGKTTTFKSLTHEILPTFGQITINGMTMKKDSSRLNKLIGYCPQHDCLFDLMTVQEHLEYYSKLKNIPKSTRQNIIDAVIKELNLQDQKSKPAGTLSGGNKRRLQVALAILKQPPIILLDEPSAGMDPEARRFMWSVISGIFYNHKKSAVVLTTHSMEEAEALSTKMGIMVKGGIFRCFGSGQHIKNKYGSGYEIQIKLRNISDEEIQVKAENFGFEDQEQAEFDQLQDIMKRKLIDDQVIGQLNYEGIGRELYQQQLQNSGKIKVKSFLIWLINVQTIMEIIKTFLKKFETLQILECYNGFYKIRIPLQIKSIGFLFEFLQAFKDQNLIQDYSISQTTLEQIFQSFTKESNNEDNIISFTKAKQNGEQAEEYPIALNGNQSLSDSSIKLQRSSILNNTPYHINSQRQ